MQGGTLLGARRAPSLETDVDVLEALGALGFGLLVCLCASLFNQVFQNPVRAAYILVIGGSIALRAWGSSRPKKDRLRSICLCSHVHREAHDDEGRRYSILHPFVNHLQIATLDSNEIAGRPDKISRP